MQFEECEISGNLVAEGITGQFWILEGAWNYLERVTPTAAGPKVEKIGCFCDEDDAMIVAGLLDNGDTDAFQMFLNGEITQGE